MSDERINSIKISDYGITPYLNYYDITNIREKFDGGCLKQDQAAIHGAIVNIYIVYEISKNINISVYPALENCLFRAFTLTKMLTLKNMDILVMELDLIEDHVFHIQTVEMVKV